MRRWIAAIFLLQFAVQVQASEYGHYEVSKVVALAGVKTGKPSVTVNVAYLNQILDDLGSHALTWPPQFDSPSDRQRAEQDVRFLNTLFDPIATSFSDNPAILLRLGIVNGFGHNMDVVGSAERAVKYFDRVMQLTPESPQANFRYGQFLAVTAERAKAIPYLEKAKTLGVPNADYWLGVTYASIGDRSKAIENLESYTTRVPADVNAAKILDAVQHGNIEVKQGFPASP